MNKKISIKTILFEIILIGFICYVVITFDTKNSTIHSYYKVYLNGKSLGLISSSDELYNLIDEEEKTLKEKYNVDKIYPPSGLDIQKVKTYNNELLTAKEIYEDIKDLEPFTIEGYTVKVKDSEGNLKNEFYILNKEDLDVALKNTVEAFVDEEDYDNYLNSTQIDENDEGTIITNIYFDEEVTLKKTYISTEENIITNSSDMSRYFLFGKINLTDTYTVKENDTIEDIASSNQLGVNDLLVANPTLASASSLLAAGQTLNVSPVNPIANIVVETYETSFFDVDYETVIEYDLNKDAESEPTVKQEGKKGKSKVVYATKYMNGVILQTALVKEETITEPTNKIIVIGRSSIYYVGSNTYWAWPTNRIYRISSYYGWRVHPVYNYEKFHNGVDITGTPNDNLYAIQDGTITKAGYQKEMGNYIYIDHHNGYVSIYMHCRSILVSVGQEVVKGELVGYMGCTGTCTGKHLHLTVYKNGSLINPLSLYK